MNGSVEVSLFIMLVIVLAGPLVAERLRIPALIGLIAGGMIVGPFVFGWISTDSLLSEFGDVGLLFLMFLAGISFNLRAFIENRSNAIVYGLLGFVLPFVLSIAVSVSVSELGFLAAALIGAMWASNTLVAYPDVVAAGLQNNRAVSAAVSAGVVADLLSLTVLAIASSTAVIEIDAEPAVRASNEAPSLPIYVGIPLLIGVTLWLLPKIADWFFVRVGHTRAQRFLFSLAAMAGGATVATLGGVEGLIGAFLAGLGLNRLVPAESELMRRLDFVGGTLFVPAFLVSIGLSIDPAVLFDIDTLILAGFFTAFVVVGKTSAALITGRIFSISIDEVGLMASLSFGQAASTLAIAQVGISLGFFDQEVVNAAVLTIVICAFLTSIGTRFFSYRVDRPVAPTASIGERILADTRAHGGSLSAEMAVSGAIARPDDGVVTPYAIPLTGELDSAKETVAGAEAAAAAQGHDAIGVLRIDDSFAAGTLHLAEEKNASLIILRWDGLSFGRDLVFGNEIDAIGSRSPVPVIALRTVGGWTRVIVATGDTGTDWKQEDALLAVEIGHRLARAQSLPLVVVTKHPEVLPEFAKAQESVEIVSHVSPRDFVLNDLGASDMLIAPAHVLHKASRLWSWRITRALSETSVAIVGGPRRMTVSGTTPRRARESLIGPTTEPIVSRGAP